MKQLLLVFLAVVLNISLSAQTTLTEAIDFTATDIQGKEINLFEILDRGQYVLIHFFYSENVPCQAAVSKLVKAYQALGCNNNEVYFMEISPIDDNATLQKWVNDHAVKYPTMGRETGCYELCSAYGISLYPTIILIAPDREIVINDLYPIYSPQTIIGTLAPFGIEEHDCQEAVSENGENAFHAYPNPANEMIQIKGENIESVEVFNSLGQKMQVASTSEPDFVIPTQSLENGVYFARINEKSVVRFVVLH